MPSTRKTSAQTKGTTKSKFSTSVKKTNNKPSKNKRAETIASQTNNHDPETTSNNNSDSTSSDLYPFTTSPSSTRQTATHIYFHSGILSNWHTKSLNFAGARCFELMIPHLDELGVPHPPPNALSTVLMSEHMFNCGEQWMMAVKGWLFETGDCEEGLVSRIVVDLECDDVDVDVDDGGKSERILGGKEYSDLKVKLMNAEIDAEWKEDRGDGNGVVLKEMGRVWDSTVCRVLRAKTPHEQKVFGRLTGGFDVDVWTRASVPCTVAALVARAEVDARLRYGYLHCGKRKFVEGAKTDLIWGVGIKWNDVHIEDETLWRGENRLGKCHDEAARLVRSSFNDRTLESGAWESV